MYLMLDKNKNVIRCDYLNCYKARYGQTINKASIPTTNIV